MLLRYDAWILKLCSCVSVEAFLVAHVNRLHQVASGRRSTAAGRFGYRCSGESWTIHTYGKASLAKLNILNNSAG
jgi:hypothetical protein